ncbi:MAG: hypothetical protein JXB13_06715 [Phycisphaerae bacterium]|nr:hypothetical protein [Phycisphaerae bacterium]
MHCVNCGYLLFNLTRPVCPECGRAFRVGDYRFAPGSVDFLCPGCLTPLEGGPPTSDLAGGPCAHCGAPLDPDTLSVRPRRPDAVGVLYDQYEGPGLPPGSPPTVWPVWKRVMVLDGDVFRDRARRSSGDAYWFAACCTLLAAAITGILYLAIFLLLALLHNEWQALVYAVPLVVVVVFFGLMVAMAGPLVFGGAMALPSHMALMILEPNCRPFHHTFRTACYAMAPVMIAGIPIVGALVALPYAMTAYVIGIRAVHETSTLIAFVSALWLPVLLVAMVVLL